MPRIKSGLGALLGLFSLFLNNIVVEKNKGINCFLYICVTLYSVVNIFNYSYIIAQELEVNELENKYVEEICAYVDEYEEKNNVKIDKIFLEPDVDKSLWFNEIHRELVDFYNSCVCSWSCLGTINYYSNRKFVLTNEEFSLDEEKDYEIIDGVLGIRIHKF